VRLIELRDHTAEQLRKIEEDYASRARLVDGELRHWRKRLDPLLVRLQQEQETQGERLHAALAAFEDRLRTAEEWSRTILYTADTHQGARARAGLWFNPPVAVAYDKEDRPFWSGTNERVIEKTWTIRQLAAVPKGATLLDLGCSESTLALELASNGYHVTAIDVRSYPFTHPNLQVLESDICKSGLSAGSFDAVISVSTIEHIGLGAYGDSIASRLPEALQEVRRLLRNQGKFFITVPFGIAVVTDLHRVFNSTSLRELLAEFTLEKLEFGRRVNDKVWISPVPEESVNDLPLDGNGAPSAVCMAVCVK
jgi:SAM-dependent methyltransferase